MRETWKTAMVAAGVLATIVAAAAPDMVFEAVYRGDAEFSNEMYNMGVYSVCGLICCGIAWAAAGLFYYVVNSVRFSRWYHWLSTMGVAVAVSAVGCVSYADGVFSAEGYSFGSQLFGFGIAAAVVQASLYTLASFSIRWWSSNCRHTPIPE